MSQIISTYSNRMPKGQLRRRLDNARASPPEIAHGSFVLENIQILRVFDLENSCLIADANTGRQRSHMNAREDAACGRRQKDLS